MPRVVFFGSPDFALPSLEALARTSYKPVLVVTQPDRPAGRGRSMQPTPVRRFAEELEIPTLVIETFKKGDVIDRLRSLEPDFSVAVAFGLIFPVSVLEIPSRGSINLHASLLPSYRGASPVNGAIVNGELFTGVTTMEMVKALDAGPIYLQRTVPIDPMENAGELSDRLAAQGASLLIETLQGIEAGTIAPVPQPEEGVHSAPRLGKRDGLIPWDRDAIGVHNHIRGMNPWPGSFTYYRGRYLKVHRAQPWDCIPHDHRPGQILVCEGEHVIVACGRGSVRLVRLQSEGKRPLDAAQFLRGYPLEAGEMLGGEG
ncbi:MAG: methionyl-tRNA formyltransferase [bacterium]|nr:MAG: methionyl-tRNA formyltransferase [bacterium]